MAKSKNHTNHNQSNEKKRFSNVLQNYTLFLKK